MTLRILPLPATPSPLTSIINGARAGQRLQSNYYKNQMTADQARYLPKNLATAHQMALAKLSGQNIQNTAMPGYLSARTALEQAMGNDTNARTQGQLITNQYEPGLDQARTSLIGQQAAGQGIKNILMPKTVSINQQNANTKANAQKFNTQRFGNAYAFSRLAESPAGKALLAANPNLAKAYASTLGNLAGSLNPGGGLPSVNGTTFTPQQIHAAQTATGAALQKETSDEQTRQQALGAQQLIEEANKINIKPLLDYSGFLGSAEIAGNKLKSGFGLPLSQEAVDYNTFKKNVVPIMSDQIRQALKTSVHPTYVMQMIKPLADPQNSIYENPQEVIGRWNYYKNWLAGYAHQKTLAVTNGVPTTVEPVNYYNAKTGTNEIPATNAAAFNPATFVNSIQTRAELRQKYASASPEQQQAIRTYMASPAYKGSK